MTEKPKNFFFNWKESSNYELSEVGGKGLNLSRLDRYGFQLPAGGILISKAYRDFLYYNNLIECIQSAGFIKADEVLENEYLLSQIRNNIQLGTIPETIIQELLDQLTIMELLDRPVAVRSSAASEDSAAASFAGVHDSFLNINGFKNIVQAIKGCYASLWTPRAISYRRRIGIDDVDVSIAVVIMELVEAKSSGVAFSCDPRTGQRDRIAINANFGYGESVVSGAVEPDEYLLHTKNALPEIIEEKIGRKKHHTELKKGGGSELIITSSVDTRKKVLDNDRIIELGTLTLRVYEALGSGITDQDIEWVFNGERFFILQARPVTGIPIPNFPEVSSQPVIWSNANIKDAVPVVLTTLSWSGMCNILNIMLGSNLKAAGYKIPDEINWIRLYNGRGYFNLSAIQWGYYDAFGYLPGEINASFGGHQPEINVSKGNPLGGKKGLKRIWRRLRFIYNIFRIQRSSEKTFKDMWDKVENWNKLDFRGMSDIELISHSSVVMENVLDYALTFVILGFSSGFYFDNLSKILERDFPGRGLSLANNILAGSSDITSAEHGYRLMELAKIAQEDENVRGYFTDGSFQTSVWKDKIPQNSQFRKEFDQFLKDYGHRGVYEVEIQNPRWKEDPSYLLEIIRSEVISPSNTNYRGNQINKRKGAEQEIAKKFWGLKRINLDMMIKQARKSAGLREMSKSVLVKPLETTRLFYQEIGLRFVERGIISDSSDIYHIAWHEIASILAGYWDGFALKILISERKKDYERFSGMEPPDVIIDEVPQPKTQNIKLHGELFTGLGVAAGKASGKARLIHHPKDNSKLQAGEVLVAPSTDPGWTPLFLRAKALVMEVGGYLSHGAIVAREYGIPAVVNVPGVMKNLHDGESLTVDGDEGKVYRGG